MGFLLPKAKSISGIADVQDCGVPSPLPQQTIYRGLRYCDHTVQIVRSQMFLRLLHDDLIHFTE
ncbi:hypothetical protein [Bacillus sp. RIT 809]|uniref:hypothetical protein n=1 Tax=Bacillus sp. RIT 809 TaxID=2803857 RepID=UPI00194F14EC|nr:hypothetical protein [Bacillus sp. RIT 809]MBM6648480.1 hypothetical protein [Bacillus sp. RIT 809]